MKLEGCIRAFLFFSPLVALPACRTAVPESRFYAFKAYVERLHDRISAEADRSSGIADEALRVRRILELEKLRVVLPWAGMLGVMAHAVADAKNFEEAEEAVWQVETTIERYEKEAI
ncbi:MAG TPA: hypothetical protein VFI25_02815 [Planctomycetota bacterium]|jgi:hypothetical protein|nr:hypothetical protein [Planctomycetota bacterium]